MDHGNRDRGCNRRVNWAERMRRARGATQQCEPRSTGMPATMHSTFADRKQLPLLSCGPLLQGRERHYWRGSQTGRQAQGEGEGGGSKVPARVRQYGASRSNHGKREKTGLPVTKKYEHRRWRRGHNLSNADRTDQATQEGVQYQRAGLPGLLRYR